MNTTQRWQTRADSLARAMRIGRGLVDEGKGNLYQIGSAFFEASFGHYLFQPQGNEWRVTLDEGLALFALALERDDCRRWPEFPHNEAHLHLEAYIGQWWAGRAAEPGHLDRAINLTIDALFDGRQHPLGSYAALPPLYLLRRDSEHLASFWKVLSEQSNSMELPPELALWKKLSDAFLTGQTSEVTFWEAFTTYARRLKTPTDQPARFFLAIAKIGLDLFGVAQERDAALYRLAVAPWEKAET